MGGATAARSQSASRSVPKPTGAASFPPSTCDSRSHSDAASPILTALLWLMETGICNNVRKRVRSVEKVRSGGARRRGQPPEVLCETGLCRFRSRGCPCYFTRRSNPGGIFRGGIVRGPVRGSDGRAGGWRWGRCTGGLGGWNLRMFPRLGSSCRRVERPFGLEARLRPEVRQVGGQVGVKPPPPQM